MIAAALPLARGQRWHELLTAAHRGSAPLGITAMLMLLAMIPTTLAGLIDPRELNGVNIWIKPLKFQLSIAVHLATVALALLLLPPSVRDRWLVRTVVWALVAAALFEAIYITVQASRGAASHYNVSAPWAAMMYLLMGGGAVIMALGAAIIGVLIVRHGRKRDPIALAAGLGLMLGGVLGGLSGIYMSAQPAHWVGPMPGQAGLWPFGWSLVGGDLRVAHFFGLHAMQMLPITGWLAAQVFPGREQMAIWASAALVTAITGLAFGQAVAGVPFIRL